jgi:hypothetical protein
MAADGMSDEEILKAYPDPTREDIRESLRYAAEAVREREIPIVTKPRISSRMPRALRQTPVRFGATDGAGV